jgi:hypothetical protein
VLDVDLRRAGQQDGVDVASPGRVGSDEAHVMDFEKLVAVEIESNSRWIAGTTGSPMHVYTWFVWSKTPKIGPSLKVRIGRPDTEPRGQNQLDRGSGGRQQQATSP